MYKEAMYNKRHARTLSSAQTILGLVLKRIPDIKSAVDVGCGVGTWLSVLLNKGISDIQGVDGNWVDNKFLVIPSQRIHKQDLRNVITFDRKFDLAISLEVAEHLPEENADGFVASLTSLADVVLFSAAVPYQGGRGHVNEQWPPYWAKKFENRGFVTVDFIRSAIWESKDVTSWYKQNVLMFATRDAVKKYDLTAYVANPDFLSIVHPKRYLGIMRQAHSIGGAWKLFRRAVKAQIFGGPAIRGD